MHPGWSASNDFEPVRRHAVGNRLRSPKVDSRSISALCQHTSAAIKPHPALMMLQGSGATDRNSGSYFPPIRDHFIENGLAVFSLDKSSIGGSTGDWRRQTLFGRSDEALDALAWLREQPGIDAAGVGVWGHSQGDWIGPLVASRSADVAYLVVNSGPGITPETQDLYGIEHTLRRDGAGEADIAQGLTWMHALPAAAREGTPYEQVAATLLEPARGTCAFSYLGEVGPVDWPFFVLNFQHPYDPVVALERVTCSLLAIFGVLDPLVPAVESARIFAAAAKKSGNRDVTIRIFPAADHRIRVGDAPGVAGTPVSTDRSPVRLRRVHHCECTRTYALRVLDNGDPG